MVDYDETGSIGKRYRRQDEIGTVILSPHLMVPPLSLYQKLALALHPEVQTVQICVLAPVQVQA